MPQPINEEEHKARDTFLGARARLGILITNRKEGTPMGVPVWFDWDGETVRMFAGDFTTKIKRIRRDPRASLLVTNDLDELEYWVAFDGTIELSDSGGIELAEKLAERYWDLADPERRKTLEVWRQAKDMLCVMTLRPTKVRSGSG